MKALTGLGLVAAVLTIALTFATIELPQWLARLTDRLIGAPDYHPELEIELIQDFLTSDYIRPIGYACLSLVLFLIVAGLMTKRIGLSKVGALLLFIPTVGAFAGYMFFLAGLGVLRVLWLPAWSDWLALGDITYLPYMLVVWPLWLLGLDVRYAIAYLAIGIGLLILVVSMTGWLVSRATARDIADFWLYRHSRHPQYLGWIIWSWGLMLLSGLQPVPLGATNPGASLPWLISSLVIVAVAWVEETRMLRDHPEYARYRDGTPFLFPVPKSIERALRAPIRWTLHKDQPETGTETLIVVAVYLTMAMTLSLPFVLLDWPPMDWWSWPM